MTMLNARETKRRIRQLGLENPSATDFAFREKATHLTYGWHSHRRHQLLYSLSGRVILQSQNARWLLPPQRAAWIPAGVPHRTTLDRSDTLSVFFKSIPRGFKVEDIRVIRSNPLLREMLIHASRWSPQRRPTKKERSLHRSFFAALILLCLDWIEQELPFRLPTPKDSRVEKAAAYLLENLDSANIRNAARLSGQSVRTLRRRFLPATGFTWQQYALHARMLHAMDALLSTNGSVLEISLAVGYSSPSAFTKAFTQFSGSSPLAFRKSQ